MWCVFVGFIAVSHVPVVTGTAVAETPVHEFNLANGNMERRDAEVSADVVIYVVDTASSKPVVEALSEVCEDQFDRINYSLRQLGYTGFQSSTLPRGLAFRCNGRRGNALFVRGNVTRIYVFAHGSESIRRDYSG